MKIDIPGGPPTDIFKDRRRHTLAFILLLALAGCGLIIGGYAVVSDTKHYAQLEIVSLAFFVGAALLLTYFGEKLQGYKKLTLPQEKELAELGQQHCAIKAYCDQVAQANRQPILAEYEACQEWAEDASSKPTAE